MKGLRILPQHFLALFIAICLAIAIPIAYAVVKNVTIVDAQGNALANTKVTIVFPDGTEVEEETDDDGILVYDFPGDGEYTVNYPGGQMAVSVSGGVPTSMWVAGGVAAVGTAALIVVAVDDDSDNPATSGSPPSSPPPSSPPPPSPPPPPPPSSNCTAATFNVTADTPAISNPSGHPEDEFNGLWDVSCSGDDATVNLSSGTGNTTITWTCTVDGSGNCFAGATSCIYATIPTTCSLPSSVFSGGSWTGQMSGCLDGACPGGGSILQSFTGN